MENMSGDLLAAYTLAMDWKEIPTPAGELAELRETEHQARRRVHHQMSVLTWSARRRAWHRRAAVPIYGGFAAVVIFGIATLGLIVTWMIFAAIVFVWSGHFAALLSFPLYSIDHDVHKLRKAQRKHAEAFAALAAHEAGMDPALVWPEAYPVTIVAGITEGEL